MGAVQSVAELHERASRARGLSDFGSDDYREGLDVLLEGYRDEAELTEAGADRVSGELRRILEARLVTVESWRRHPTYAAAEVCRPIFVTGLPRSGTTALHRLLCLDDAHQGLEQWLTEYPRPRPPRDAWPADADYRRVRDDLAARERANPGLQGVHFMSAESVEECGRLDRQTMRSVMFESTAYLPGYTRWLRSQDLLPVYRYHRRLLQLIGLNDPGRRWVLKWPSHMFGLHALMEVYPDALVVQTHRDPRTVIGSISSLCQQAAAGKSDTYVGARVGTDNLDRWSSGVTAFMEARQHYDPARFVDVRYDDFIADAPGTVERIYRRLGIEMSPATRDSVRRDNAASRLDQRRPVHRYALSDFGLSEGEVTERFRDYLDEYGYERLAQADG